MRFLPLTPDRLVAELADWIDGSASKAPAREAAGKAAGLVIGFDGPVELGTTMLVDRVAERLQHLGRPVIRACTRRWWRPSALRLELGREDVDMLLTGWVDDRALRRELIEPVTDGTRSYITELQDPNTDRSIRQRPQPAVAGGILLLDGPFLLATELPLDALVALHISDGALRRALAPENSWWAAAFRRYIEEYRPADQAEVLISYDHAAAPAVAGLQCSACLTGGRPHSAGGLPELLSGRQAVSAASAASAAGQQEPCCGSSMSGRNCLLLLATASGWRYRRNWPAWTAADQNRRRKEPSWIWVRYLPR